MGKKVATALARKPKAVESSNDSTMFAHALQKAVDQAFALIRFETNGTIIHANNNFLNALGYRLEEVVGKHHSIFCSKDLANSFEYKKFWESLAQGTAQIGEFKRITKAGQEIWIQASYSPLKNEDGEVFGVAKIAVDITQMKKMALMKQMVDLSPVNTLLADPTGTLVYMNENSQKTLKTLEKHLPDRVENLVGKSIDWFHKNPEHQKRLIADPKNLPIKAKIQVGPEKLDLLVSPIRDTQGNYVGPMVTWSLITDRVQLVSTLEETSSQLAAAAEELSATATQLNQNSNVTAEQSTSAAANTEEVSKGVQIVATNTEELVASIKEISRNTAEAATISKDTLSRAQTTNHTIQKLGASSEEIGNVIKVISSIAQQTNLLALNATIEAARAGEAGKGFAVVANEVKELAKQTAKATEDITHKINAIQGDTKDAVTAIDEIGAFIEKLNSISVAIAAAVEEQTATANEVSRVVRESNRGVEGIAEVVRKVSGVAKQSSLGSSQTLESARSLAQLAEKLSSLVKSLQV
jgi:methyl-accepting chemotaxis protein